MFDPKTTMLIHRTMIQEELQRSHPEHNLAFPGQEPGRGSIAVARTITARMLRALGDRISPLSSMQPGRCGPITNPAPGESKAGAG